MKNLRQKKIFVVLISVLVLCLIAGAITMLVLHQREEALEEQQNEALQELYDNEGRYDPQSIVLSNTTKPRAENLAEAFGAKLRITEDGSFAALTLPEGVTVFDIYENEEYRKYIEYMSLDYQAKISDLLASDGEDGEVSNERLPIRPQYTVSDTDYNRQTYLDYLNMSNVWNKTKGKGITVAVIDTGIDTDHPEFAGRISEYSYNATEDKIVKDYMLPDGSLDWSLVEDEQGHGTAVAGVIAASMNGNGVVGIAPQVNIIVIKAECNEKGEFKRTSDLVFGLYYAIERDVAVVNMSFGGTGSNPYSEATQLAFDSDVICVAAAGNGATAALQYPAADENVFGVGALAEDSWELAAYSNYGENVDFVAPGTVYTTQMGGGYGGMDGTSFASPITAGVLALYLSQNKYQEFNTIEEILYASCYDLGDLGPDFYYGYGALDVSALMLEERGKVTFNMMTDELDNTEQVFIRSHTLQNMPEPERLYAIFDGWYYDPQCTDEYVWYEDEFHGDLTLYANWVNEDDGIPFTYVELDDGTIEIRSYTGHRRYITIPDYIDGKVVSSIGEFAFAGETRLREVKLPKYLKRIRTGAFSGCSNLVSMEIPDTVTEIGDSAFYDNVRLSTLIFGQNSQLVSIGDYAFSGCAKMRTFTVPSKVMSLNATAFYRNTSMISFDVQKGNTAFSAKDGVLFNNTGSTLVCYPAGLKGTYVIPETVKTVGNYAFAWTRLSCVELSKVETLGAYSFVYGSLENIVIPDSVISMGDAVFADNGYLRLAKLGAGLTSISSNAFDGTALTSIEIPAGIRSIGDAAFADIGSLAEVTFAPNSTLTYIGSYAFADSGLVSVEIPASVVTIGGSAFASSYVCSAALSSVVIDEDSSLNTIYSSAFMGQYRLTVVDLPDRLAHLGDFAFYGTGLTTVDIPASVTYFGAGAFASCHSLENIFVEDGNMNYVDVDGVVYNTDQTVLVEYPAGNTRTSYNVLAGVTDIGATAFYGSWNLQYVYFQEGLKHIRSYAFYDTRNIERIDLPNSIEILDECSFYGCGARQYKLPQNLREIKMYALSQNTRLTSISIPDSVMQISNYAFAEDWNLRSVTFTENAKLPRISFGAFAYCGLTSFRVPANVSTIAQGAFMGCSNLQSFTFAKNSKLTSISAYMFDGCSNLRTITFEKGSALTSIQAHGLEGMRKLTKIDFGDAKLTNIDNFAFRFCESLTRFDIPEGVTFLGRYVFYYCTNLSEVTVPSTMDFIGRFAFLGTKDLNVYFAAETLPPNLAEDWDHGTTGYYLGVTDVVTDGDWKYAKLTSGDISIIEYNGTATDIDLTALNLGGDIVNIGGGAFMDSPVERIVLPETLQIIQAEAFYHSELKSISIPASVTFIGREAFAYTPIEALTFASNAQIKTIEQSAFEKTEKLGSVVIPASVTTMGRAVFKSSGITTLTFANGFSMTEIPEEAFAYTHISAATIPDSVTVINHNAFREIKELKSVTLGNGAEMMIMSNVFYQSGLVTVYIPENVGYVGEYAFVGLHDLTEFTVAENNPNYKAVDGLLVSKNGRKLIAVPAGKTGSLTVPEGIEVIGFGAFEDSKLSEIKFLDNANILSFGYRAFYNADGITEMHIPASVVAIDYYSFAMCDNLQTVTFAEENNLKGVYEGAFYGCKNLSDIMLPDSIVEISDFAFYGCRRLTDVPVSETTDLKGIYDYAFAYAGFSGDYTTPETLIDIGPYAFMGNKFASVTVPGTNAWDLVIGIGAFAECNDLVEITVPFIGASFEDDEITWFGYIFGAGGYKANTTFVPESLKKVNISEGITFVGEGAFNGLTGLEEMSIPHSVQLVYDYAFNETTAKYELTNAITFYSRHSYALVASHIGSGIFGHLQIYDCKTGIGDYAFSGCSSLTSIEISNSAKSIGAWAFASCSSLTSITVPDSVTSIGYCAFSGCSSLTCIYYGGTMGQWLNIPFDASNHPCAGGADLYIKGELIKDIIIPDGVTSIGGYAFYGCSSLTSIEIPDSVTSIGNSAFYGCNNLTSVVFGENSQLTSIGYSAFYRCGSLTSIKIPDSVTSIGSSAFYGCSNLTSVDFGDNSQLTSIGENAFYGCSSLTSIEIPDSVTIIGNSAFYGCNNLTSIEIPDSVTSIGNSAFYGCSSLTSVELGDNSQLTSIGYSAFRECRSLTSIKIPDSVTSIGGYAFVVCSSLTSVEFGENSQLTSIGYDAFYGCSSLTSIEIPDGVTSIDNSAFAYCSSLTSVDFGDNNQLTSIGSSAFSSCSSLTSIEIPDSVTSIGSSAFYGCRSLTSVYISDIVAWMQLNFAYGSNPLSNDAALYVNGKLLTELVVPNNVTNLGNYVFDGCTSLKSVRFENDSQIKSIGEGTFADCENLCDVILPEGITSIGFNAFHHCKALSNIIIPSSVTRIDNQAFWGCSNLYFVHNHSDLNLQIGSKDFGEVALYAKIIIDRDGNTLYNDPVSGIEYICTADGFLFEIHNNRFYDLIAYMGDLETVTLPLDILGNTYEIYHMKGIKNVVIPEGRTSIDNEAFYDCFSLRSIIIPESVTSIGKNAFYNCDNLTNITLPDSLTSIGCDAFYNCDNLTNVTLPDNGTNIDTLAFRGCFNLKWNTSNNNSHFTVVDGVLYDKDITKVICLPSSFTEWYVPHTVTSLDINNHPTIQTIRFEEGSNLTVIPDSAFIGCSSLTSVDFGDNSQLTSIGKSAFWRCSNLTSIEIPDSVTSIGNSAFAYCSSLTSVDFGDNSQLTSIGDSAFSGCSSLTSIEIPDSVTSVGQNAFYNCSSLTSIDFGDNSQIASIGNNAFLGCTQLKLITLDNNSNFTIISGVLYDKNVTHILFVLDSVTNLFVPKTITYINLKDNKTIREITFEEGSVMASIDSGAFRGCSSLTSIEIPDSVTSIGQNAFYGCNNLTSIEIPDSVTSIGHYAFYCCSSLTSVDFGDNSQLARIGDSAFYGCSSLTSIEIPDGVTSIGYDAFSDCDSLTSIKIPDSATSIGSFSGCGSLTSLDIPEGVTRIAQSAFENCYSLTSITIPDSVTVIGWYAFENCSSLTSIEFGDNSQLTSIGVDAFRGCSNLTSIDFGDNSQLTSIGDSAFSGCSSLTSVDFGENSQLTSIGDSAFWQCSNLTSIEIPDSVTSIGNSAFLRCSNLTSIEIPDGVTSIDNSAFWQCSNLTSIEIPDSVTSIGNSAFYDCSSLTSVDFGENSQLTSIGNSAFAYCSSLTSIEIPDSVTSIGNSAFAYCSSLTSVDFGDNSQLTSIGEDAFYGCSSLTSIDFGDNSQLTSIGEDAFYGCSSLTSIEIPDSVMSIGDDAFLGCTQLQLIVSDNNSNFTTISGVFYDKNVTHILFVPDSVTNLFVPKTVTYINLEDNKTIREITFEEGSGITSIDIGVFRGCSSLTSIEIPDSVTNIGNSAFYGCNNLTSIKIPDSVTSIGERSFYGCSNLTSIEIPDSVTSIGNNAFYDCSNLRIIYNNSNLDLNFMSSEYGCISQVAYVIVDRNGNKKYLSESYELEYVDNVGDFLFEKEQEGYRLIAYAGNLDTVTLPLDIHGYPYDFQSMRGIVNVIIPQGFTSIPRNAFSGCSTLTSITIPDSVTSIGDSAFYGCSSLTSIEIPDSVTSIGEWAFRGCSSLTSITIPNSVTSIGKWAFRDCSSLTSITIPNSVTGIGSGAFDGTAYYNNPNNWADGFLYIGNYLIKVHEETKYVDIREGTASIANDAYKNCYMLKNAVVWANNSGSLSSATNLETLVITEMPTHYIYQYFGSSIPLTLKSIVLGKDVQMRSNAFYGITGITIYVEANEKDVRWDENYPGWNNGNKVVYGDEWITADFYDQNGNLMSSEIFLTYQVIRQPYLELAEGLEESQVLVGWDIDGDGVADTIPATSTLDIVAYPVIETRTSEYVVKFFDADGVTLLSKAILPYGAVIVPPAVVDKQGYTVSGWIGYTEGMTVSGNHTFVLDRVHNGGGHDYTAPVWVAPTCTEAGYNKHVCSICGEWYATDHMEPLGHDYTVTENPATCTEEGEIIYTCRNCGDSHTELTQPKGHSYHGTVQKEATCTKEGEMRYACEDCGDQIIEKTPMAAHDYQKKTASKWWLQTLIEKIMNIFFGYEGDDVFYYECTKCKRIQTAEESKTGNGVAGVQSAGCAHQLGEWVKYIAPTCEGDGVDARFCSICEKAIEFRRGEDAIGHSHHAVVTAPTCIEKGYTTHTCVRCEDTYVDREVAALGHTAGSKADCLNDQTCTVCGEILTGKLGHAKTQHSAKAPTCTEIGWNAYETCSRCDYTTYVKIPATGHSYNAVVAVPTCTEQGYTTHICHCGDTYVDSYVDAPGHDYNAVVTVPTCIEKGYTTHTCTHCEDTYVDSEVVALGHTAGATADCLNDQTCTVCGAVLTEKLGHDYKSVVTAPTCTEQGYTTHTCSRCDDTYTDSETAALCHTTCTDADCLNDQTCTVCGAVLVEKLGHDYKAVVTAPTCTEQGYTTHTCTRCNDTYVDSVVAELGHTAGVDADCLNDQTCTVCGAVLTEKLGHDYKSVVTDPTCTDQGYTTHTCSRCDDTYTDSETEALSHALSDWIVDTEAQIGVEGSKHVECTICGEILETGVIEALPVETEPETETSPENETPAEIETFTEPVSNQEGPTASGGCFGIVSVDAFWLIILMSFASLLLVKRREENR